MINSASSNIAYGFATICLCILLLYQIDSVGNPSWQAQVLGTKLWTLIPPPECYFECTKRLDVTVSPGEISMSTYFEIFTFIKGFRSAIAKCRTAKLKLTLTLVLTLTDTGGAVLTLMLGYRSLYITWQ